MFWCERSRCPLPESYHRRSGACLLGWSLTSMHSYLAILVNRKENLWVCKVRFKEQCKLGIAMVLRGSHVCCGTHRSQKQHATHIWSRLLCPFVPRSQLCLSQHSQNSAKLWLTRLFTKEMCEIPQVGIYHIGVCVRESATVLSSKQNHHTIAWDQDPWILKVAMTLIPSGFGK